MSGGVSGWRVRRRRRKRRQLRAEKGAWSPHKVTSHLEVVGDEDEEEEEEVQMIEMEVEEAEGEGSEGEGPEGEGPEGEEEEVEEEKVKEERTVTGEEANVAVETGVRERRVAVFVQLKRPGDVQVCVWPPMTERLVDLLTPHAWHSFHSQVASPLTHSQITHQSLVLSTVIQYWLYFLSWCVLTSSGVYLFYCLFLYLAPNTTHTMLYCVSVLVGVQCHCCVCWL